MKISDISIKTFRTHADRWDVGHAQPLPNTELMQTVLTVHTDDGASGHYFGGGSHGDAEGLNVVDQHLITTRIRDLLVGQDPLDVVHPALERDGGHDPGDVADVHEQAPWADGVRCGEGYR